MTLDPAVETRITDRLDAGDLRAAATETLRAYGPEILGYLRAILPGSLSDDAFSLFCEQFWKGLPRFRRDSSVRTWVYQIAWSAARRLHEDPMVHRGVRLRTTEMEALAQEVRSTTARHLRQEAADQLARIRSQLDVAEQTLLVLRIDRDLGWSEIADVMSEDSATLRKRFERLKAKIRALVAT